MKAHALVVLSAVLLSADAPNTPCHHSSADWAAQEDLSDLQGSWSIIGLSKNGVADDLDEWAGCRWVFIGDSVFFEEAGKHRYLVGTVRVDRNQDPPGIDLIRRRTSRLSPGVCRRTGDTLIWAYTDEPSRRPPALASEPQSGVVLWTLKRDNK